MERGRKKRQEEKKLHQGSKPGPFVYQLKLLVTTIELYSCRLMLDIL